MDEKAESLQASSNAFRRLFIWIIASISLFLLLGVYILVIAQFASPRAAPRLEMMRDVPLPSALPDNFIPDVRNIPRQQDPLAPGLAVPFDHFDFQAFDPNTKLLFIAHTGPAPDKFHTANPAFNVDKDTRQDGQIIVLNTRNNKVIGRVNIPQVTGMTVAPDSGMIFASGSADGAVYAIDEHTLHFQRIDLGKNERPDAMSYDPTDHKLFVSDLGNPDPVIIDPGTQNLIDIDTRTFAITKINLGRLHPMPTEHAELARWGYAVGHNHYDAALQRVFVTLQQLTDPRIQPPQIAPGGTGELISVDPISDRVVDRIQLPRTCGNPHGMVLDEQQSIAFIACMDSDPTQNLVPNLVRINLHTMQSIPSSPSQSVVTLPLKPDILVLDHPLHTLFVGSGFGIAVFDESGGHLLPLGSYNLGKGTHTIALNETTQVLYVPLVNVGGRPTLRITRYSPRGT